MPTVLRHDGFRISVLLPPREHGPPHVHVCKAGAEVVIDLDPLRIRTVDQMRNADVFRAVTLVEAHRDALLTAWRKWHG